jgi:hypothetical protein
VPDDNPLMIWIEHDMQLVPLADINQAARDSSNGNAIKPILRM